MTLEQLRAFLKVAELLNMTRAAEALHLTQPAVSAAIAALEGRHGTRLFDRVGKRLELTEAGRMFLPEAQAVVARSDAAQRVLEELNGLMRGEVRMFASQTVANYWLPARLARFAAAHPQISLSLSVGNTAQAAAAVMAGDADLGFVEGAIDAPLLKARKVGGDQLGLYAAPGHALAGRRLKKADLAGADWVLREKGSGTRAHFMDALARYELTGEDLSVRLELPSNDAVLEAVQTGALVAVVSDLAALPRLKAGMICRLDCDLAPRSFRVVRHSERQLGRAAGAFLESLKETGAG